jgi:hypothetical protein
LPVSRPGTTSIGEWLRSVAKVRSVSRARQIRGRSLSVGIGVNALEFLDLSDGDGSSSLSLEHGTSGLHILSDKGHHLLTLVGIGHVRRDWEIDESVLGDDDNRRAVPNAIHRALQIEVGGGASGILDGTSEVANGTLDRHRLRVGIHLSTLTRKRRTNEHDRKNRRKEHMEESGALHISLPRQNAELRAPICGFDT